MPKRKIPAAIKKSPFDTEDLRTNLAAFLNAHFFDPETRAPRKIGDFKWGVYAFYDYGDEPIYVGQTNEKIRSRIGRHLTNQRTDAVAMSVLDPFEVKSIEIWPLPHLQKVSGKDAEAKAELNALENAIYKKAKRKSKFKEVLNEKNPKPSSRKPKIPKSLKGVIVSSELLKTRSHSDLRLARRALTIARLAQVIAERKVQNGLRRVLLTQAKRLTALAQDRYDELGGERTVEKKRGPEKNSDD